jgi:alkylation response protein AidB-like acyl-CoA dehydrogenase
MKDNSAVQGLIGRTEAKLRAARAYHFSTAANAWQEILNTGKLSEQGRAAIRLSATYTIHQSAEVVETAYHMAGATAVFKSNPFERRFRDMHTIAQQIQARDNHFEDVGKMILTNSVIPRGPTM